VNLVAETCRVDHGGRHKWNWGQFCGGASVIERDVVAAFKVRKGCDSLVTSYLFCALAESANRPRDGQPGLLKLCRAQERSWAGALGTGTIP
jgi:hypothetical protein